MRKKKIGHGSEHILLAQQNHISQTQFDSLDQLYMKKRQRKKNNKK